MNGSYPVPASSKGYSVRDGSTESVLVASPIQTRKRSSTLSRSLRHGDGNGNGTGKLRKVSRACDFCKARKARCSGDWPCAKCVAKGRECLYDARYTRGRPPTPPQSEARVHEASEASAHAGLRGLSEKEDEGLEVVDGGFADDGGNESHAEMHNELAMSRRFESTVPSRASPELGLEEIQGQVFDPTSNLTFLHRAWKRLSSCNSGAPTNVPSSSETLSLTMAGDRSLPEVDESAPIPLPDPEEASGLLSLYFDVCIATYRILHRPAVESWLRTMEKNVREGRPIWHEVGRARAAIVLVALAMATLHREKSKGSSSSAGDSSHTLRASDELFCISTRLADQETGYPRIESVQARVVHVLYLLTTARFNRAWYVFGTALQLIAALGLHRRARRRASQTDFVSRQCCVRTFWTAYILDTYLGIIFGRPRHFHDDDVDQVFPDRVDEEMATLGESPECHIDALIFHAKIAQIVGCISRQVYAVGDMSSSERVAAAQRLNRRIREWHASLPLHLGSIPPSMLITSYRRQATVLKLAHAHAIMHANRLFLLLGDSGKAFEGQVGECVAAAKTVLETVDGMATEGPIFHAFWWTHHVMFCALVVTFVWEIQQRRSGRGAGRQDRTRLMMDLAERCQGHLARATASNSPSRKYAVILDEFRAAARQHTKETSQAVVQAGETEDAGNAGNGTVSGHVGREAEDEEASVVCDPRLFDEWQTTDWLDLDSSAFRPGVEIDEAMMWPAMF